MLREELPVKVVLKSVSFLKKKKASQRHCFLSDPHCVFAFMFSLVGFSSIGE